MWEEAYVSLKKYFDLYNEYYKGINLVNATGYTPPSTSAPGGGYASGTNHAAKGWHRFMEAGDEYVIQSATGAKYRLFNGGEKVLNASATDWLYRFANSRGDVLDQLIKNSMSAGVAAVSAAGGGETVIQMGDIIIQGNTNDKTVSEIRRAQRDGMEFILKELTRLGR